MQLQKFSEFLKNRGLVEFSSPNANLNRPALDFDRKLSQFNARFSDPKKGLEIVNAAGYKSVGDFLNDPDERKWSKLKEPGQQNYVR